MNRTTTFSIPTADGRACLNGQIDLPESANEIRQVVLIVPGGWFMEREGYMGGCSDERAFMYRQIALSLCEQGLAVARYDNRGVHGNELTMPKCESTDDIVITRHYLRHCIDFAARGAITPETWRDDIDSVSRHVLEQLHLDDSQLAVVAHSEGAMQVAKLIEMGRLHPRGVVLLGASMGSPASVFRWQTIDRCVAKVLSWDADRDGRVTHEDVERGYSRDSFFADSGLSLDQLLPPEEWSEKGLTEYFTRRYEQTREGALLRDPRDPHPDPTPEFEFVAHSQAWWQQWFKDETPLGDRLRSYRGFVAVHCGELDSQCPIRQGIDVDRSLPQASLVRYHVHPNRGHALADGQPLHGPIADAARMLIVSDVLATFQTPFP